MAKEYIEREAAKHELLSWAVSLNHPEYLIKDDALHVIDSIPAADVATEYIENLFSGKLRGVTYENGKIIDVHIRDTDDVVKVFVPVRHGRWEEMHYEGGILDGTNFDRCSICGYERVFDDPALKTVFKYCPNCGAKMDGGAD